MVLAKIELLFFLSSAAPAIFFAFVLKGLHHRAHREHREKEKFMISHEDFLYFFTHFPSVPSVSSVVDINGGNSCPLLPALD